MGKEEGRRFGIKPIFLLVRKRLGRSNPLSATIDGPELTQAERDEQHLIGLPGTKKHADAARGDKPFDYKWRQNK